MSASTADAISKVIYIELQGPLLESLVNQIISVDNSRRTPACQAPVDLALDDDRMWQRNQIGQLRQAIMFKSALRLPPVLTIPRAAIGR